MLIKAPYENGVLYINGIEVLFRDYQAEVSLAIGKKVLLKGLYTVGLKNEKDLKTAKRILFIREIGLGDVLLATPLVRKIKKEINPEAKIDWMVAEEYKGLLLGNPYIENIITINTIRDDISNYYEKIIKLNECEFEADSLVVHRIDVFASRVSGLGMIEDKKLDYFISNEDKDFDPPFKKYVVMVIEANCRNRKLPKDRLQNIANLLVQRSYNVVLVDKDPKNGWEAEGILNTCGKNSIRQTAQLIYKSKRILTPDTGMMHVASAMNKKVVAYFGAIDWKLRKTHDNLLPLVSETKCYPCGGYGCQDPKCIKELPDEYIVERVCNFVEK